MFQLLIILLTTIIFSIVFDHKAHHVLPILLMAEILFTYAVALFVPNLSVAMGCAMTIPLIVIAIMYIRKKEFLRKGIFEDNVLTPQLFICLIVCIFWARIYSNHCVYFWDDMSYWGIYAKDLFCINKIPKGVENCTIQYKDYMPIMQIMQVFFMRGASEYNETVLTQVNICFLYVLMLPLLDGIQKDRRFLEKLLTLVLYLIFPHVFTTQFYNRQGVDYLMSILFGYGLYLISSNYFKASKEKAIQITIVAAFVTLVKTTGIVLALFLVLLYAVCDMPEQEAGNNKPRLKGVITRGIIVGGVTLAFYFSWIAWGKLTGNHGYLSDKVESNIRTLARNLPDYTGSVVVNYIKHFFTCVLTREKFGITAAVIMACIIIVYCIRRTNMRKNILSSDNTNNATNSGNQSFASYRLMFILLMIGQFIFCCAHIYMYLFVFDKWEADGLLEFDRYICQYMAGVFFFYIYDMCNIGKMPEAENKDSSLRIWTMAIVTAVLVVLLPYKAMNTYLVPSHYDEYYKANIEQIRRVGYEEADTCGIRELNLPYDEDHRLMLISNAWLDEFQNFTYALVPQPITVVGNVPAVEEGNLHNYLSSLIESNNIKYVYVNKDVAEVFPGDFYEESKELTKDGEPLCEGSIYECEITDDDIWLTKLK